MDLVSYDRDIYESIAEEYKVFLQVELAVKIYKDLCYHELMKIRLYLIFSAASQKERSSADKLFRMPAQDVYNFTGMGIGCYTGGFRLL